MPKKKSGGKAAAPAEPEPAPPAAAEVMTASTQRSTLHILASIDPFRDPRVTVLESLQDVSMEKFSDEIEGTLHIKEQEKVGSACSAHASFALQNGLALRARNSDHREHPPATIDHCRLRG